MSENKFIKQLKGKSTTLSVLEIQDKGSRTSFAKMPQGTSDANMVYSDARNNATAVLTGAMNWKIISGVLDLSTSVSGDGDDYTGESEVSGVSDQQGNNLWINSSYTVPAGGMVFTKNTKWVLKLCGDNLIENGGDTIGFAVVITFGNSDIITKTFTVKEQASFFCKEMVIDFAESNNNVIKLSQGDKITLKLLSNSANASARIYQGMTTLTALQRRVDADAISSNTRTLTDIEDDVDELFGLVDTKVNKDGTSIMTAPLKFVAGSLRGGIGPTFGGVEFYTLNNDSPTYSLVTLGRFSTNGFLPHSDNTYNIGSTARYWKDAYIARVITAVLNNGYDIAVPVTNGPDTLALKSQVDDAANSGEQLYTTGVWYAKMYSATVVPTGAEYDGQNYADFSQVDSDNNPIVVIYEGQSGSWVEIARITPPENHVAYLTITSKIWDIAEQTDQQGGEVLWSYNQKTFTPYPKIVSVAGLANTDMDNLTATGKNIANWSTNVSNCITYIPQDIKLELNAGTLTLKAGSKVYVPNGAGVFDTVTIANDIVRTAGGDGTGKVLFYKNGTISSRQTVGIASGSTPPSSSLGNYLGWYDTTNNVIKLTSDGGSTWDSGWSFPFCITHDTNGAVFLDQVFNGFGYIGSSVFALPNIKWLTADGRNADGTLKNKENTNTTVLTTYYPYDDNLVFYLNTTGVFTLGQYIQSETEPTTQYTIWYKPSENILRAKGTGDWSVVNDRIVFAYSETSTTGIVSFNPIQTFHALDYNDTDFIAHQAMPSARYIDLTLLGSGGRYDAPADGWFVASSDGIITMSLQGNRGGITVNGAAGFAPWATLPVSKGAYVLFNYSANQNNKIRFYYAEGAK